MTPCIARDGNLALYDPPNPGCVACGTSPQDALRQLAERYLPAAEHARIADLDTAADKLTELVAAYVNAKA